MPNSYDEVEEREDKEQWNQAIIEEMNSLTESKTWSLIKLPEGRKAIETKWVFRTKQDKNANIVRYKEGLVAKDVRKEKISTMKKHMLQWQELQHFEYYFLLLIKKI